MASKISFSELLSTDITAYKDLSKLKNLTNTQLRYVTKGLTQDINRAITKYEASGDRSQSIETAIKNLQRFTGTGRAGGLSIGLGGASSKNKTGLIRQIRELQYIQNIGLDTELGEAILTDKYERAWKKFNANMDMNISQEQYRDVTENFGAVGSSLLEQFESSTVVNEYLKIGKKFNLAELMNDTYNDLSKEYKDIKSIDPKILTDELVRRMKEYV